MTLEALRQYILFTVALRLLLAVLAGGLVGYGRSKRDRAAGFRTYILISLDAAMSVLLTLYDYELLHGPWADVVARVGSKFDASRLASQAVTGIGFLGTAMVLLTETWLGLLGKNIHPRPEYTMELMYDEKTSLNQVLRLCKDSRMAIVNLKIHTLGADDDARYAAEVFLRGNVDREALLGKVRRMPGIVSAIAE